MRTLFCSVVLACTVLAYARGAWAQDRTYVEKRDAEGQDIRFDDDPLDAVGRETVGAQIKAWITAKRFLLARPRQTFVPEMLKNVEAL
jgi:hypothetical protein